MARILFCGHASHFILKRRADGFRIWSSRPFCRGEALAAEKKELCARPQYDFVWAGRKNCTINLTLLKTLAVRFFWLEKKLKQIWSEHSRANHRGMCGLGVFSNKGNYISPLIFQSLYFWQWRANESGIFRWIKLHTKQVCFSTYTRCFLLNPVYLGRQTPSYIAQYSDSAEPPGCWVVSGKYKWVSLSQPDVWIDTCIKLPQTSLIQQGHKRHTS